MRGLRGKTFIIAGGATGIGSATAERLALEGANVVVGDINVSGAEGTVARIKGVGGHAIAVGFDLTDDDSVQRLVGSAIDEFGAVYGLHNVGADLSEGNLGRDKTLLDTPEDVWMRTMDVSLHGYIRMSRAVLPHMLKNGQGCIVNTSSGASLGGDKVRVAYGVTKAGVNQLTRNIATCWGKKGIRCNGIMPGLVMGETQQKENDTQLQQGILMMTKSPRLGRPSDIAGVVAFLMSDDGEWINGQTWSIDGGLNMRQ
jgi:NAD(P)-dependent dehydrogenase (short-subunit alcohol dehydrogenase family)